MPMGAHAHKIYTTPQGKNNTHMNKMITTIKQKQSNNIFIKETHYAIRKIYFKIELLKRLRELQSVTSALRLFQSSRTRTEKNVSCTNRSETISTDGHGLS